MPEQQNSRATKEVQQQSLVGMPYQVDYRNEAAGKWISKTKRCITFKFGYVSQNAISQGKCGVACRTSENEHQVQLIWSITSGKSCITYDGIEIHYEITNKAESKFEKIWMTNDGHTIKLCAYAVASTSTTSIPNIRQFDMLLDGRSYFDFPRIFELGNHGVDAQESNAIRTQYRHVDVPEKPRSLFVNQSPHQSTSYAGHHHSRPLMEIA
jgi:hypothetical protein